MAPLADVSVDQIKVRCKRCCEQIAIVRDQILKTSASLEHLEADNNFLRERSESLREKTGQTKNEDAHKMSSKIRTPSATKRRIDLSITTLEKVQEKLSELEKIALSLKICFDAEKELSRKTKFQIEELKNNFQNEKKKNGHLQEIIISMKNQSKREATSRDVAHRRLHLLTKEIQGLTHGLSLQKSSHKKSSDCEHFGSPPVPIKPSTPNAPISIDGIRSPSRTVLSLDDRPTPRRRLAIRWDFWYHQRQGYPMMVPAQDEKEKTWNKCKTVYASLAFISVVYFMYVSVSSFGRLIQKTFF